MPTKARSTLGKIPFHFPPAGPTVQSVQDLSRILHWEWGLDGGLVCRLLNWRLYIACYRPDLQFAVTSGIRTAQDQRDLKARGYPAADPALSTHVPLDPAGFSTGVDVDLLNARNDDDWRWYGVAATAAGLRWGGGSTLSDGIPSDRVHLDLGPKGAAR